MGAAAAGRSVVTADNMRCEPVVDTDGTVLGHARVSPDLGDDGRRALLSMVKAAIRHQEAKDAADPVGAAERDRRYEAGQQRIRERNARLRGESQ